MEVGANIKAAREKANLTQNELGEKIGVTGVAIMRYEKGQREPKLATLQKIAIALNVPLDDLLGGVEVFDSPEEFDKHWKEAQEAARNNPNQDKLTVIYKASPETRLKAAWGRLNDHGQEAAAARVEEVAEVPKYQKR